MAEGTEGGERQQPMGVRLPPALRARLDAAAAKLDRTVAWCIRKAIEEWLDRQGRRK